MQMGILLMVLEALPDLSSFYTLICASPSAKRHSSASCAQRVFGAPSARHHFDEHPAKLINRLISSSPSFSLGCSLAWPRGDTIEATRMIPSMTSSAKSWVAASLP